MTVDQMQQGQNLPANPGDFGGATGLEDFGVTDAVIPRLQIIHKEGKFKDNLSGQEFDKLRLIILGLVKQRILWHPEVDNSGEAQPMCRSNDYGTGYPNLELSGKKAFPWEKSGFNPSTVPQVGDHKPLPCANCQLKEWGSHPNGNTPYCSEQWTLPVYYDSTGNDDWMPALLTLQKSSIKPLRSYLTPFSRTGKPAFTSVCEVSLSVNTRGSVDYSIPSFVLVGESDRSKWMEYSENYAQMKEFLTAPPRTEEGDSEPQISENVNTAPVQQQYSDPNDPWASQPQQQPVQQVVQEQAAPQQQASPPPPPQQQPPAVQQPVAPSQPTEPPPTQQPVQSAPPAQQAPPAQPSGNDLPF